jgi:Leucine-rich repeat (LRR) protein
VCARDQISTLRTLDLSSNALKALPASLGATLAQLKNLKLDHNKLEALPELASLAKVGLGEWAVATNDLRGSRSEREETKRGKSVRRERGRAGSFGATDEWWRRTTCGIPTRTKRKKEEERERRERTRRFVQSEGGGRRLRGERENERARGVELVLRLSVPFAVRSADDDHDDARPRTRDPFAPFPPHGCALVGTGRLLLAWATRCRAAARCRAVV